jgi:serpin B
MEKALKFEQYDTNDINQTFSDLIDALLNADNTITLDIAHSIWYKQGFNVLDTFKDINRNYYKAEVKELDFYKSDALDIINGWIEDNTGGKIRDMIKEIDPDHVMFLINAIYFKGSWKTEFEEKSTYEQAFYINPDKSVSTQMMHKTDTVAYQKNEMFSAIELPYGRGNFNMAILLPNEDSNLQTIIDSLTTDNWSLWMNSFGNKQEVNITIPRFTIDYNKQLNDVLSDMGMKIAFESTADFCGINPDADLYIDYVQHNTFIDVNEKGTKAAAATVVAMRECVAMPPTVFNANRPFLYAITEKETGTILFIGKTVNPTN